MDGDLVNPAILFLAVVYSAIDVFFSYLRVAFTCVLIHFVLGHLPCLYGVPTSLYATQVQHLIPSMRLFRTLDPLSLSTLLNL